MAEWLRRWTANPMCSARVGSNPIGVVLFFLGKDASMHEYDMVKSWHFNSRG